MLLPVGRPLVAPTRSGIAIHYSTYTIQENEK